MTCNVSWSSSSRPTRIYTVMVGRWYSVYMNVTSRTRLCRTRAKSLKFFRDIRWWRNESIWVRYRVRRSCRHVCHSDDRLWIEELYCHRTTLSRLQSPKTYPWFSVFFRVALSSCVLSSILLHGIWAGRGRVCSF